MSFHRLPVLQLALTLMLLNCDDLRDRGLQHTHVSAWHDEQFSYSDRIVDRDSPIE